MAEITLDVFIKTTGELLRRFQEKYIAAHDANPTMYPLSLLDEDAGLWTDFFDHFLATGEV